MTYLHTRTSIILQRAVFCLVSVGLFLPLATTTGRQVQDEKGYVGSIDNRFGIHMRLQRSGEILLGTYYYDRIHKPIAVKGTIDATDRITLDESDGSGANTARFLGKFVADGILAGTWTKPGSDKAQPFLLEAESPSGKAVGADDRVIVVEENVVLQRLQDGEALPMGAVGDVVVRYPRISGLKDQSVLARARAAATLKKVLENSIEDYKRDLVGWLYGVNYKVNYNRDHIVDITFWQSGCGAYPDTQYGHLVLNLKTGSKLRATDVFAPASMSKLAGLVNRKLHAYIQQAIKEFAGGGNDVAQDFPPNVRFRIKDLGKIRIEEDGITFLWEFGFPHVIKPLEPPDGGFYFTYDELKPYLRRDGLLHVNLH